MRLSLDTSCVLNLLNPDEVADEHLVELLRLAMLNDVNLYVTEVYVGEVAGAVEGRRGEVVKRAKFLPKIEVPSDKVATRDLIAAELFAKVWPNSPGDTKMAEHGRRDCLHLAAHMLTDGTAFVTRDARFRDKVARLTGYPEISSRVVDRALIKRRPPRGASWSSSAA